MERDTDRPTADRCYVCPAPGGYKLARGRLTPFRRACDPPLIATVARGSSDHAATYLKYAVELQAGIPVASVGPSVASIYHRPLRLRGAACIGISQSGRSPDIVAMMRAAAEGGALPIAITNHAGSPMAEVSANCLALEAGEEKSVAATKTFVNSVLAGLALVGAPVPDRPFLHGANETGRRRAAQGVPLEAVLRAYRLGGQVTWEALLADDGHEGGIAEALRVPPVGGFGTVCASLVALGEGPPVWRFAAGPAGEAPFLPVHPAPP